MGDREASRPKSKQHSARRHRHVLFWKTVKIHRFPKSQTPLPQRLDTTRHHVHTRLGTGCGGRLTARVLGLRPGKHRGQEDGQEPA